MVLYFVVIEFLEPQRHVVQTPEAFKNEDIPRLIFQHFNLSQTVAQTRKDLFSTAKACKASRNLLWTRSGTFYSLSYHFSCFCPPPKSICEFYLIRDLSIESVIYWDLFFYEVHRRASFDDDSGWERLDVHACQVGPL